MHYQVSSRENGIAPKLYTGSFARFIFTELPVEEALRKGGYEYDFDDQAKECLYCS